MAKAKTKEEVKEEVKASVDLEAIKSELDDYIDIQIRKKVEEELEKTNKRIWREKNRKLFFKNVVIIILVLVIAYLLFILYKGRYFDKYLGNEPVNTNEVTNNTNNTNTDVVVKKEPTLDELIDTYGVLLKSVVINEKSQYLEDFYKGKVSSSLKNYIALNSMDLSSLTTEEDYNIIDEKALKETYEKIINGTFENESFDYDGVSIKYFSNFNSYLSEKKLEKNTTSINREIMEIKVDNKKVTITTVEGLIKEGKLYNILTNEEVEGYNADRLSKFKDKLNVVKYVFDDGKFTSLGV